MAEGIIEGFLGQETFSGDYAAPASKSVAQRVAALSLIRTGKTTISNYGNNQDSLLALQIIQDLGATVTFESAYILTIDSEGIFKNTVQSNIIDFGESGLSSRMFLPLLALLSEEFTVSAKGSLTSRPFSTLFNALNDLDVSITPSSGTFPLNIKGPLKAQDIHLDGSQSSQFLTGLLFAYAAGKFQHTIEVENLVSKPYIDLSIDLLQRFEVALVTHHNYAHFSIEPLEETKQKPLKIAVEGDWSNAAFFMVAAAIKGHLHLTGLDVFSLQADKAVLEPLMDCGCRLSITDHYIDITTVDKLRAFQFDATHAPDLFPPLAVLAAYCEGTSVIMGTHRLRNKESDRAQALISELTKMGLDIREQDDLLIIKGGPLIGTRLNAHNDHRIAMALAIAALGAQGSSKISGVECVAKSYPDFFTDLKNLGAKISIDESL